jgi:hypothetical protein
MSMIGFFNRMSTHAAATLVADPACQDAFFQRSIGDFPEALDVDKAWHAIHFALAGRAWPDEGASSLVIFGGEPFGEDLGYGPARLISAADVQAAAAVLADKDPQAVARQLDLSRLDEEDVYPGSWSDDDAASRDYIAYHFDRLRSFYGEAASKNEAVVVWMS